MEALAAAFILAVAVGGMLALWGYGYKKASDSHDTTTARELARAELERAKAFGYDNLPLGTVDANGSTATFRGTFTPSAGGSKTTWSPGVSAYFDAAGNRTSATSSNARYRVEAQITDSNFGKGSTRPYGLGLVAQRSVLVSVTRLPGGQTVLRMGTQIVRGGL